MPIETTFSYQGIDFGRYSVLLSIKLQNPTCVLLETAAPRATFHVTAILHVTRISVYYVHLPLRNLIGLHVDASTFVSSRQSIEIHTTRLIYNLIPCHLSFGTHQ